MFKYFFFLFVFVQVQAKIINLKLCEYEMYQHIQCNSINIKLNYNSYFNKTSELISFITTTQQYCDEYKNICKIEQYYPRLSVIRESSFGGILKDYANDNDDLCMIFIINNRKENDEVVIDKIITINYNISYVCLDENSNSISTTSIIIICISIVFVIILGYMVYCKYKIDKKEITGLKEKLHKYSEHDDSIHYPINISSDYQLNEN